MTYDPNNVFAKILRGEIPCNKVLETEHSLAFHDINPLCRHHVLVIPKGSYVSLDDFSARSSEAEIVDLIRSLGEVARMLGVDASGYRIMSNHGHDARQEVPHLHFHVCGGEDLGPMLRLPK
ncbi:MAG TPA: HIT domain-containing protein [Kiloniellales bacterium]|jgi:histidine triad (HIT) family protein|nr:HIT domain-containing protein [Kiloniellales bacterium]